MVAQPPSDDANAGTDDKPGMGDFAVKQPSPEEMAAMQQRWMEASAPSEHHRFLERFLGEWDTETRMGMGGMESPPMTGSSKNTWLVEGRWLKVEHSGDFMGMPYVGHGIIGYDNFKKKYTQAWVDNMSTAMNTIEGLLDMTGDTLTMYGTMDEPMTGEHDKAVKWVFRFEDDDHYVFEIHDLGIVPGETKVLEVKYARKAE